MTKLSKIVIAVPKADVILSSVCGTYKLFHAVSHYCQSDTEIILAGCRKHQTVFGGLFSIHTQVKFTEITDADLIVVPAVKRDIEQAIADNKELCQWLDSQYRKGAHIASLCSGAFFLGAAGLLTQRRCTTHWLHTEKFLRIFPDTKYCKHNVLTEDDRVFTSGGAFTFLNLIVYLIERFYGKDAANWAVGVFQVDYHRQSQSPFVLFESQKSHTDESILRAQQFIEQNYAQKLSLADIAEHCRLGVRTMARRFKECSGNTPNEYLQRVRIEKAKELLAASDNTIAEIQYMTGYNDPKTFRSIFSRYTSLTPSSYRSRYTT